MIHLFLTEVMVTGIVCIEVDLDVDVANEAELATLIQKVLKEIIYVKGITRAEEVDSDLEYDNSDE